MKVNMALFKKKKFFIYFKIRLQKGSSPKGQDSPFGTHPGNVVLGGGEAEELLGPEVPVGVLHGAGQL
jgi:hypothetical protein